MNETAEILHTIEHLQQVLENLIVRGLRSAGTAERATLAALNVEFDRIGAHHLAGRIGALCDALHNDDRSAAASLLKTQASLRVFERILTLEFAQDALMAFASAPSEDADEPD